MSDRSQIVAHLDRDALWTYRRMVDWTECPHLLTTEKKAFRMNLIDTFGEDSNLIQSMIFGRFQRTKSAELVYSSLDIDALKRAMRGIGNPITGPRKASIDFSGGGDAQCLMVAEGTDIKEIEDYHDKNEITLAKRFVQKLTDMGISPWDVTADAGGLGATVIKYMETDLHFVGINKYFYNQKPRQPKRFKDKNTENHYRIKRLLALSQLKFSCPPCEELLKEIRRRQYELLDHEVVRMESKKRIRARSEKSPDHLDCLVMITQGVQVDGFDFSNTPVPKSTKGAWDKAAQPRTGRLGSIFDKQRPDILKKLGGKNRKFSFGKRT